MKKQVKVKITWIQSRLLSSGLLFFNLHTPVDHLSQLHGVNNHLSAYCFTFFSLPLTSVPADGHTIPAASWASSPGLTTGNVVCPNLTSLLPPYRLSPSIFLILDCGTNIYIHQGNTSSPAFSLIPKIQILLFLLIKYFWRLSI